MSPLVKPNLQRFVCFPGDFSLTDRAVSHHGDECDGELWEPGVIRVLLFADIWPDLLCAAGSSHLPGDPLEVRWWHLQCPGLVCAVCHWLWHSVVLIIHAAGDGALSGQYCAKCGECDSGHCTGGCCGWSACERNTPECLHSKYSLPPPFFPSLQYSHLAMSIHSLFVCSYVCICVCYKIVLG